MPVYTTNHKQVLRHGEHFVDACDPGAAVLIADALNMRAEPTGEPMTYEAWAAQKRNLERSNAEYMNGIIEDTNEPTNIYHGTKPVNPELIEAIQNASCQAYRCGDQMLCPCGRQWDVNDPDPILCAAG